MADPNCIVVFLRAPRLGKVKTRLARMLGDRKALALYRAFVEDGLATAGGIDAPLRVYGTPAEELDAISAWLGSDLSIYAQKGATLGDRMANAFARAFSDGCSRVVLIGTDAPGLPKAFLMEALKRLEDHSAVIGPATDGGYYLIGFNRENFSPQAFEQISWGGPKVFQQTMAILQKMQASVYILPAWRDIDEADDLRAWMQMGVNWVESAPQTVALLQREDIFH